MPLSGIKIVELGLNLAGPLAGAILADLGASVVKVERPVHGDDARAWGPPFAEGTSLPFHNMNRNKESLVLDLKQDVDRERLYTLIESTDIFIQNMRPGTAENLGVGPESLLTRNRRLIYCNMNAFGHDGPLKDKPGYEILLQAFAGLMSLTGEEKGPPVRMGASVVDYGTGMWTAIAALAALRKRDQTGAGCVVTTSLLETAIFYANTALMQYKNTGKPPARHATGSPRQVAFGAFRTKDGPLVLGVANTRLFFKLARVLNYKDWCEDDRYSTNATRMQHREELTTKIARALAQEPKAVWMEKFEIAGIPCAPILSIPEVLSQPQTAALKLIQSVPGTDINVMSMPFSLNGRRPPIRRHAPRLGEHDKKYSK